MPRLPKATKKPDPEALKARLRALRASSDGRLDAQGRSHQEQIQAIEDEIAGKAPVETVGGYVIPVAWLQGFDPFQYLLFHDNWEPWKRKQVKKKLSLEWESCITKVLEAFGPETI